MLPHFELQDIVHAEGIAYNRDIKDRAVALVRFGKTVPEVVEELGIGKTAGTAQPGTN